MQCLKYARRYTKKCNDNHAPIPPKSHPPGPLTMVPIELLFITSVRSFTLLLETHP